MHEQFPTLCRVFSGRLTLRGGMEKMQGSTPGFPPKSSPEPRRRAAGAGLLPERPMSAMESGRVRRKRKMRAEIESVVQEIKQSLALLRRHL
jgi:hypothetical protein